MTLEMAKKQGLLGRIRCDKLMKINPAGGRP
jgi:hypothetical protein